MNFLLFLQELFIQALESEFVKQFQPLEFVFYVFCGALFTMFTFKICWNYYFVKKQQKWMIQDPRLSSWKEKKL
jgi:multisubunit Na+/H+ antiporter MnhB subunit